MAANPSQPSVDPSSWGGIWNSPSSFPDLADLGFATTASSAASATTAADSSASRGDIPATTAPTTAAGNAGAIGTGKNGNGDSGANSAASKWGMPDLWGSTNSSGKLYFSVLIII